MNNVEEHQNGKGAQMFMGLDKFKTWPSKTSSNDGSSSFKNLNQIIESPVIKQKKVISKSGTNSFESAVDDLNLVVIGDENNRLSTVEENKVSSRTNP